MTQNIPPYEASTALPPQAMVPSATLEALSRGGKSKAPQGDQDGTAPAAVPEQSDDMLAKNEVRISDGRVVRVRRTSAYDAVRLPQVLKQAGFNPATLDGITMGFMKTLFAIEAIDNEPYLFPKGNAAIEAELRLFWEDDFQRVMAKYGEVSGLKAVADSLDGTFQSA